MTNREEIINSLNACMDVHRSGLWSSGCAFCSYAKRSNPKCFMDLTRDAIELLKHDEQTIASLQSTIDKLTKALSEKPEQKFFVDSDGKITPLPIQKHGHWIVSGEPPIMVKTCSECNIRIFHHSGGELEKFCAWCGAKMDEEVINDASKNS